MERLAHEYAGRLRTVDVDALRVDPVHIGGRRPCGGGGTEQPHEERSLRVARLALRVVEEIAADPKHRTHADRALGDEWSALLGDDRAGVGPETRPDRRAPRPALVARFGEVRNSHDRGVGAETPGADWLAHVSLDRPERGKRGIRARTRVEDHSRTAARLRLENLRGTRIVG